MELITTYFSDFTLQQIEQLTALEALYKEWNEKINVISRKDVDNFYLHHVLHSLSIATQFQFRSGTTILDLGTGGGFPGIPLAIMFPDVHFHLVDSINKKLKIVTAVAEEIGIKNVTTQHTRAEDIKNRKFASVVSRAVAPLGELWRWSRPLIEKNNRPLKGEPNGLICLKGGDLAQEISDSGCKPFVWEIEKIFKEDFFKEKYLLHIKA